MGDIAAVGDNLAAAPSGFNPNIKPKTKNVTGASFIVNTMQSKLKVQIVIFQLILM